MEFVQILALSFCASVVNNTTSTTESLHLVPGLKYWSYEAYRTRTCEIHVVHKQKKSLQSGSHMFLNVPNELRLVPSLLDEVVGVVLNMIPFSSSTLVPAQFSVVCSSFMRVPHLGPG